MPSRTTDFICALAGLVLCALVFAPWWEYVPPDPAQFASGWTAYAPVEVVGTGAWDGAPSAAFVWVATGGLAASLVALGPIRADGLRFLRLAVAAIALVSLAATTIRLAGEPPQTGYAPAPVATFGLFLIAMIAVSAFAGLRRT